MESQDILVQCDEDQITINGEEITFPLHLNTLNALFGEPSRKKFDIMWNVLWDDLGIYTSYGTWDNITAIHFLQTQEHDLDLAPEHCFEGRIILNGEEVQKTDFETVEFQKTIVGHRKGENGPYAISIYKNYDYTEAIPEDKYVIKDLDEEIIEFKDFGFKVSIIQELMYVQELLKPKFDLYEFIDWYDGRKIDYEEEGYEPIPEVTQYFKDLPIPKRLAPNITRIRQDGGNDIYLNLICFAEGSEDYWDIETIEDVKQFPNLKKAVLCYAKEHVVDELNDMGIEAKWL